MKDVSSKPVHKIDLRAVRIVEAWRVYNDVLLPGSALENLKMRITRLIQNVEHPYESSGKPGRETT